MILRLKDKALPKGPMTSYKAKIMFTVKKIQEMVIIITGIRKNNKRSRKKYLV